MGEHVAPLTRSSSGIRSVSLSAYVDLPIEHVAALFAAPAIDDLLASAVRAALSGSEADADSVHAHVSTCAWVSSGTASVPLTWRVVTSDGQTVDGTATISLLVVQSGHDAITELLVAIPVAEQDAAATVTVMRQVLDELTRQIARQRL